MPIININLFFGGDRSAYFISSNSFIFIFQIQPNIFYELSLFNSHKRFWKFKIFIKPNTENKNLLLEVNDFGIGFNVKAVQNSSKGLGLRNIIIRVDAFEGNIYLNPVPEKGTTYTIEMPNI